MGKGVFERLKLPQSIDDGLKVVLKLRKEKKLKEMMLRNSHILSDRQWTHKPSKLLKSGPKSKS